MLSAYSSTSLGLTRPRFAMSRKELTPAEMPISASATHCIAALYKSCCALTLCLVASAYYGSLTASKKLGGPHAVHSALVARGIMIKPVSVRAWALGPRNIPSKYWVPIKEIADSQGVPVSFEDLAESVKAA